MEDMRQIATEVMNAQERERDIWIRLLSDYAAVTADWASLSEQDLRTIVRGIHESATTIIAEHNGQRAT